MILRGCRGDGIGLERCIGNAVNDAKANVLISK